MQLNFLKSSARLEQALVLWRFLQVFLVGWLLGLLGLLAWGYKGSFLLLNGLRAPWLDAFMPHFTHLGDGVLLTALIFLLGLRRDRALSLSLLVCMLAVSLTVFLAKEYLFLDWHRPAKMLEEGTYHMISLGKERMRAFPSGHAAASTAMVFYLAALPGSRPIQGGLAALLGLGLAYSRVYIGVHFLGDILAGSMLGLGLAIWSWQGLHATWFQKLEAPRPRPYSWLTYLLLLLGIIWLMLAPYRIYGAYYV